MKVRYFILFIVFLCSFSGCSVMKDLGGAYNMTQCKYEYNSISKLNLSGIDLSKGISLVNAPMLLGMLAGQPSSLPLNFTLNMNVSNPNTTPALLHGLQYILSIDNVQFTTGSVSESLNIAGGGQQMLPLAIGIDLASLLKGESKDAVLSIAKNFIGMGDKKSNVTLQLKPTFMLNGYPVTSPVYIPVNFAFGGMK